MSRLFLRIWLANWLAFVIVVIVSVLAVNTLRDWQRERSDNERRSSTSELRQSLQAAIEEGDSPEEWLEKQNKESSRRIFLLKPDGTDIRGVKVPSHIIGKHFRHRDRPSNDMSPGFPPGPPGKFGAKQPVIIDGYPPLKLVRGVPRRVKFWLLSPVFLVCFGMIASGLAATALARYISAPIKQLHEASDRIASGDFKSRVADSVGKRKDEIADLARRFDHMAKALETSNKNQQNLLADVSHELRSPLTRLLLISDLLEKATPENQESLRKRLQKELFNLEIMIEELMSLARFEKESSEFERVETNLAESLQTLIDDATFEANAINKDVAYKHLDTAYTVKIAPTHIHRAIENIVRNAIRHTKDNTEVTVELVKEKDNIIISVHDQGEGLANEELQKIFLPFYRSVDAQSRFKGTGLGLALAQRIIHSHGGDIGAKNNDQGGLSVWIKLPNMGREKD